MRQSEILQSSWVLGFLLPSKLNGAITSALNLAASPSTACAVSAMASSATAWHSRITCY
jgi:hypothetical protein